MDFLYNNATNIILYCIDKHYNKREITERIVKKRASALPVHDFRFLSVFTIQSNNMKIITWNINGIRTFGGGVKKTLDSLDADVICVQETKVTSKWSAKVSLATVQRSGPHVSTVYVCY